jgi:hypothetical protein
MAAVLFVAAAVVGAVCRYMHCSQLDEGQRVSAYANLYISSSRMLKVDMILSKRNQPLVH